MLHERRINNVAPTFTSSTFKIRRTKTLSFMLNKPEQIWWWREYFTQERERERVRLWGAASCWAPNKQETHSDTRLQMFGLSLSHTKARLLNDCCGAEGAGLKFKGHSRTWTHKHHEPHDSSFNSSRDTWWFYLLSPSQWPCKDTAAYLIRPLNDQHDLINQIWNSKKHVCKLFQKIVWRFNKLINLNVRCKRAL